MRSHFSNETSFSCFNETSWGLISQKMRPHETSWISQKNAEKIPGLHCSYRNETSWGLMSPRRREQLCVSKIAHNTVFTVTSLSWNEVWMRPEWGLNEVSFFHHLRKLMEINKWDLIHVATVQSWEFSSSRIQKMQCPPLWFSENVDFALYYKGSVRTKDPQSFIGIQPCIPASPWGLMRSHWGFMMGGGGSSPITEYK